MSFAGQQDTYLNVRGGDSVLEAVKRCWASLWTARALGYRARQGIPAEDVALAVVVQQLVPADVAGVLFTANPMTGVSRRGDDQRGLGAGRGDRRGPRHARYAPRRQARPGVIGRRRSPRRT